MQGNSYFDMELKRIKQSVDLEEAMAFVNSYSTSDEGMAQARQAWRNAVMSAMSRPTPVAAVGREAVEDLLNDPSAAECARRVAELVASGQADANLEAAWRRHLYREVHPAAFLTGAPFEQLVSPMTGEPLDGLSVEVVQSLGPDVAAAAFAGPHKTSVVISSRHAGRRLQTSEFYIYHMYLHSLQGKGFRVAVELSRDNWRRRFEDPRHETAHRLWEAELNDQATRLMFSEYLASPELNAVSRSLLRGVFLRGQADKDLLRRTLRDPSALRLEIRALLKSVGEWVADLPVGGLFRPRLRFAEHVAVVREDWRAPVYVVWRDSRGTGEWRRWVPSRVVLAALGLRLRDVATLSATEIDRYQFDGILIEPKEVETVYQALRSTTRWSIPVLPRRLSGLGKRGSPLEAPTSAEDVSELLDGDPPNAAYPRSAGTVATALGDRQQR